MSKWKELGEVPDSEDEDGFDSMDLIPVPEPAPTITTSQEPHDDGEKPAAGRDIWDFPDSSQPERPISPAVKPPRESHAAPSQTHLYDLNSSPLSSPKSDADLCDDHLDLAQISVEKPNSALPDSQPRQISLEDEISPSHVQILSPIPEFTGGEEKTRPATPVPQVQQVHPLQSQDLGHDSDEQLARRTAIRYQRSLRPRKPIQEHPYLLENAQYSSLFRQHGMKPLRMAIEAEKRRRQEASETSQDKDFEDDSQEIGLPEISDESQLNGLENFLDGLDEFNIPSPSPSKTSPFNDRVGPSSQVSSIGNTDNTSLDDGDGDLPTLEDLLKYPPPSHAKKAAKRRSSPLSSARRKRKRRDVVDSDLLEPAENFRLVPRAIDSPAAQRNLRRSPSPKRAEESEIQPRRSLSPIPDDIMHYGSTTPVPAQPIVIDGGSEDEGAERGEAADSDDQASTSDTESESGSEIVHTVGRRIRGVLPASWLRLDQQSGRDKLQKEVKRRAARSPEREQRRGVAQRRQITPRSTTPSQFFFDESEDELATPVQPTTDEVYHNQTRLVLKEDPSASTFDESVLDFDDGASIVENNLIDRMLPGRKRQLKLSESFGGRPKKTKNSAQCSKRGLPKASQPKITKYTGNPLALGSSPLRRVKKKYRPSKPGGKLKASKSHQSRLTAKPVSPPRLSILDVVEDNAPRFLKIAARAVARRQDQGRSSPSSKIIRLATREDHVDAMSVLNDWRTGLIPQRQSVTAAKKSKRSHRQPAEPLGEISGNRPTQRPIALSTSAPRKLVKHTSSGGSVSFQPDNTHQPSPARQRPRPKQQLSRSTSGIARPAQLETDEAVQAGRAAFHASKQLLDRLYRLKRQNVSASSLGGADTESRFASPPPEDNPVPLRIVQSPQSAHNEKSRFRKNVRPRQIDIDAPQYSHATDPIPVEPPSIQEPYQVETGGQKLGGLGPYGTQYSHHFELFPLDTRVYFHESTLIGSGALVAATTADACDILFDARPRVSFTLGDKTLRWGTWDDQLSSEFGILLDFVAEQVSSAHPGDTTVSAASTLALDAANFILKYVKDSLNFAEQSNVKYFASRILEVFKSFNQRTNTLVGGPDGLDRPQLSVIISVYDRLLLSCLLVYRLCQNDATLISEQFHLEELLGILSKTAISGLLKLGLNRLRTTYQDLQNTRFRDRGLRDDSEIIHSWVVVMKILDYARIPRGSFWDATYAIMDTTQVVNSLDAREHERLWKDMFSLLPLAEFGNNGIIVPGSRHDTAVDGWALPRNLLEKVFQLYKENVHQSPSFNSYCRALVGRCHYLVQQWGWRKCAAMIGVIFDFFGSQNLAHLRNEEVFRSPRFLEELANKPSLDVEPADRCFHIFLKLIALSIQKLREAGAMKDIRNLVTRAMPNHNRQYLKEQNIHERDLAALRNHHDLLCALFWASPPDLRPGAHIIERLVVPESSHKEACLINLRAWNQLARFVTASGEATTAFKPFAQWRNNFFLQMMQQFDSVEADIQQQFLALSKDVSNTISPEMINRMVKTNKAAVMDVIYFSVNASLDVMKHAPDLEAAAFALNSRQLQQIFKHFSVSPPEFDWAVLRVSLATLATFLSRIDDFKNDEESQQSESQLLNSAQADDAIMVVDNDIASSFFSMARCILSARGNRDLSAPAAMDKACCTEEVVVLSARLGIHFMQGGLLRLSDMFKFGKYGLFEDVPAKLNLYQRKYLVPFTQTLLKNGFDNFADSGLTLNELWVLSIIKPRPYLAYENQLAEQLKSQGQAFVPDAVAGLAINPDYNTNRDLFEFAISYMRKSVRDGGPMLKKILISEHAKTLRAVMQQMKNDLKEMAQDTAKHPAYVSFVRGIISLIRAHGSEFCTIDDFYYQISKEYSPSVQDPQLQLAGMLSYGVRLGEGDSKVVHPLFFFLINNFKTSLNSNKLEDEIVLLRRGLKNGGIFAFIVGKMLPAIIRAGFLESSAFPLLDTYGEALRYLLRKNVVPHELTEDDLPHLIPVFRAILDGMSQMRQNSGFLHHDQVHFVRQLVSMVNELWHPIFVLSISKPSVSVWNDLVSLLRDVKDVATKAESYVADLLDMEDYSLEPSLLLAGLSRNLNNMERVDSHITSFTGNITEDVRSNWIVTADRITVQAPGKGRGVPATQSSQGIEKPIRNARELMEGLYGELKDCNDWWNKAFGKPKPKVYCMSVLF